MNRSRAKPVTTRQIELIPERPEELTAKRIARSVAAIYRAEQWRTAKEIREEEVSDEPS
jgi:hypothetical protein